MKKLLLLSVILLSLNGFSQTTKAQRYEIYKAKCYTIDTVIIKQSGFLKFDTLVLKSLPTKLTYYGNVIVNKIKVSPTRSLIVVVDTIWNNITAPIYAYGNPPKTTVAGEYNKTSYRVYKNKLFRIKLCKPVTYTVWTKNEQLKWPDNPTLLYYDGLLKTISENLNQ